jgi:oligopeptide transport system substrate-binding protein
MPKMLARFLLFCSLLMIALGCGHSGAGNPAAQALRYPMAVNPTTLDPGIVQDSATGELLGLIFEGLVAYDSENKLVGQLAESWTVSADGKTYRFKLRDVKFHDGTQLTSADVKRSFERHLAPGFASPTAANYLADIVGSAEVAAGKATELKGVTTPDDRTVQIQIDRAKPFFLGKLTYPCAFVVPVGMGSEPIRSAEKVLGTGAFVLKAYQPDQSLSLAANADYYLGAPSLAAIERPIVKDAATRMNLYRTGLLDVLVLERPDVPGTLADPELSKQIVKSPRPALYFVGMNTRNPRLQSAAARRAFGLAIDRKKIAEEILGGVPVANGLIPPGIEGHRAHFAGLPFDPGAARDAAAEAGLYETSKPLRLTLAFNGSRPDMRLAAEALAQQWALNLRITVTLRGLDWTSFLEARGAGKLDLWIGSWFGDYLDPENFLSFLLQTGRPQNYDGWSNADFDRLTSRADTAKDPSERVRLYQEAEELAIESGARIPLYFAEDLVLVSPRVQGLRFNLFGSLPPRQVTFVRE